MEEAAGIPGDLWRLSQMPMSPGHLQGAFLLTALLVAASMATGISLPLVPSPNQDIEPPEIHITSPGENAVVTSESLTVSGTASDNVEVDRIHVSTDGQTWFAASGTEMWSGSVNLVNGSNIVFARATDLEGNQATDFVSVIAQLTDGVPTERGWFALFSNPVVIVALLSAIVVLVGTAAYIRQRRRRLGDGLLRKLRWRQRQEKGKPPPS